MDGSRRLFWSAIQSTHGRMKTEGSKLAGLVVAAVGIVFGDIGTSPLYAVRETFAGHHPLPVTPQNLFGILSLVCWTIIILVSVKYVSIIMRADNRGEGGSLALLALVSEVTKGTRAARFLLLLGIFAAALFYGDSMITPAISVLSAVEGLEVVTPQLASYVIPLTVVIITGLFALQSHGTATVGLMFGPIMSVWFLTLSLLGLINLVHAPEILYAANPLYGVGFIVRHPLQGFFALGSVFLAATGAEALYTDMGHFGKLPIRLAWFSFVKPALLLNYFGQGALLLQNAEAIHSPFFRLAPDWGLLPLVILATLATVIASQAVISGAFSVARQAIQLGLLPRLKIIHTSGEERGQIYVPFINWTLYCAVVGLVVGFGSSSDLAAAYGIAVTGTMVVTAIMAIMVIWRVWQWPLAGALALMLPFVFIDFTFLAANLLKIFEGGWVPLALGTIVMTVMYTWRRGSRMLFEKTRRTETPLESLVKSLEKKPPARVSGTAVFLTSDPASAPTALLHSLKHYKVLHEKNVILTIETADTPRVDPAERVRIEPVGKTFSRVVLRFGFMETPNVPKALGIARKLGWQFDIMSTSFFLSRRSLKPAAHSGMPRWQDRLFIGLTRVANDATDYYQIPTGRVVEVGTQVTI